MYTGWARTYEGITREGIPGGGITVHLKVSPLSGEAGQVATCGSRPWPPSGGQARPGTWNRVRVVVPRVPGPLGHGAEPLADARRTSPPGRCAVLPGVATAQTGQLAA